MCLAIPGIIEKIKKEIAIVNFGGVKKKVNIAFLDCKVGDYVLVHTGFAIEVVDRTKAQEFYDILTEND